ncbi:LLM class flavin-dependent oxidoreductase [Georgenia sp. SYP-B2076]|uniref:LLM class flavin-dependent oxidoreductase n=1 Tax=Georgenia sp. SYP-B2076 TaxID=2495881 RepID=UPI000F8DE248|nr:LLM class flavin-dependent oxidoreductase [Georgenia sp. SYP-B2076]
MALPARPELSFLTFVPYEAPGRAAESLRDALDLFAFAEDLGYDIGWVRVRHLERFLSSPLTLFGALTERTERIRMGTAVLPMRYLDPVTTAEAARSTCSPADASSSASPGASRPWPPCSTRSSGPPPGTSRRRRSTGSPGCARRCAARPSP